MAEITHEMVENYQRVMDGGEGAGDPNGDDVLAWLAKFRQPTHAKPMPARALRPSLG